MILALRLLFRFLIVSFGIATAVFLLQRFIPGSPADMILGADASLAEKTEWLSKHGLDKPLIQQYLKYLYNIVTHGDLGKSFANYQPVTEILAPRIVHTLRIAFCAFTVSLMVALVFGVAAAAYAGKTLDKILAILALLAISSPAFVIGPIVAWVFAVRLDWFPLTGYEGWRSLVLPSVTLGTALAAYSSRMIRSGLVDVLNEDYIRTAKAKGLKFSTVLFKHALKNAFLPALTVLGMQLGVLLSGAVITEQIFALPGLGTLTIESVQSRDYNVLSACVLVMATIYVGCNMCVDILYQVLDPRVRTL